jgi:predicted dehydrogenase
VIHPGPVSKHLNRRALLARALPVLVPASIPGLVRGVSPNEKVRLACIGLGGQGRSNLRAFLADERVQVVALCDVDSRHLAEAAKLAGVGAGGCHRDFREVLARPDVDAVMNATPDHWHALVAVAAAAAGKDLYSEKPLGGSIAEGRAICHAVESHQRVLQCGTWRRSGMKVRMACERVRNGRIGELRLVEIGVPDRFAIRGGFTGLEEPGPVPAEFDYDLWLGPAAARPHTAARCHFNFRWIAEYAPGYITDWGAHFLDVAQWGAGMDGTAPAEVSAENVVRRSAGLYDAPEQFRIEYRYANGVRVVMESTDDKSRWGTRFTGSEGWIFTESEVLRASDDNILRAPLTGNDVRLFESRHHHRNFIDAVLTRGPTAAPAETAQSAAVTCQLGAISAALGRPLRFDPDTETFPDDPEASALIAPAYRHPWKLEHS